jgi:mannose-6-phosphate isomerase class I
MGERDGGRHASSNECKRSLELYFNFFDGRVDPVRIMALTDYLRFLATKQVFDLAEEEADRETPGTMASRTAERQLVTAETKLLILQQKIADRQHDDPKFNDAYIRINQLYTDYSESLMEEQLLKPGEDIFCSGLISLENELKRRSTPKA